MTTPKEYHNRTKHYFNRFAKSLGYLDWANQPNPYRYYEGSKKVYLKKDIDFDISYKDIFSLTQHQKPTLDTLSSFLRYSLGLAAIKRYGGSQWELRVNASSGNLHPTECYIITDLVDGSVKLYHYVSYEHILEELCEVDTTLKGGFIAILTSVAYREMWKYGERALRYVNLDFGHAYRCLEISSKLHCFSFNPLNIKERDLDKLLGFSDDRFIPYELEHSDIAIAIGGECNINSFDTNITYKPNRLANQYQRWEIIEDILNQTKDGVIIPKNYKDTSKSSEKKATEVILKRRSARDYDPNRSYMSKEVFFEILDGIGTNSLDFIFYIHRVEGLKQGLYILNKSEKYPINLEKKEKIYKNFYLLKEGDFSFIAKNLSCQQDIAGDSSFAISMVAGLNNFSAIDYKQMLFECGRVGQQLYLDATSLKFSATGIGCFFDDAIHNLIQIKDGFEVLYNFTIGKEIPDLRIATYEPYK